MNMSTQHSSWLRRCSLHKAFEVLKLILGFTVGIYSRFMWDQYKYNHRAWYSLSTVVVKELVTPEAKN